MNFKQFIKKVTKIYEQISLKIFNKDLLKTTLIAVLVGCMAVFSVTKICSYTSETCESKGKEYKLNPSQLNWDKKEYSWHKIKNEESINFFDLFTPPNIFSKDDRVIYERSDQEIISGTFPLKLSRIDKQLYRLQFEGYVDLSIRKAGDISSLILFDVEKQQSIKCSEGIEFDDREFAVKSFTFDQREKNGARVTLPIIVISDYREGRLVELTNEPELYDNKFIVTFHDVLARSFSLKQIGETIQIGDAKCTLNDFNYEKQSAKITLTDVDGQDFVKELFVED